ncbi:MAG: DUF3782 domain-containing protein [Ignisphaera sp.]
MASDIRLSELKHEVLRLLKEDEEFRYAIAGLIGLSTVIDELKSLKEIIIEHIKAIRELQKTVAEHGKAIRELQEAIARQGEAIKELQKTVAEHGKAIRELQEAIARQGEAIKELQKTVAEHGKAIRELQEAIARQGEAIKELQEEMIRLRASVYAIGNRYGVVTEEAFRSAISYLVGDLLKGYRVERWVYYDNRGIVYGVSSLIEVDVLIRDKEHVLVEYKAHVDRGDISEFERVAKLYEEVVGIKPKKLVVGASVTERAIELARSLEIEIRAGSIYRR